MVQKLQRNETFCNTTAIPQSTRFPKSLENARIDWKELASVSSGNISKFAFFGRSKRGSRAENQHNIAILETMVNQSTTDFIKESNSLIKLMDKNGPKWKINQGNLLLVCNFFLCPNSLYFQKLIDGSPVGSNNNRNIEYIEQEISISMIPDKHNLRLVTHQPEENSSLQAENIKHGSFKCRNISNHIRIHPN